jgi:hypothetical protein
MAPVYIVLYEEDNTVETSIEYWLLMDLCVNTLGKTPQGDRIIWVFEGHDMVDIQLYW